MSHCQKPKNYVFFLSEFLGLLIVSTYHDLRGPFCGILENLGSSRNNVKEDDQTLAMWSRKLQAMKAKKVMFHCLIQVRRQ